MGRMETVPERRRRRLCAFAATVVAALVLSTGPVRAGEASVAVAANFLRPLRALAATFREETGHALRISAGSTGALYAQIRNGAPYEVFLAADAARPMRLEAEGLAVPGSRFTYAVGRLALWSPDARLIGGDGAAVLRQGDFRHLAIAEPKTAPYGRAAKEALGTLGLWDALESRLVRGLNVAHAFQLVATGNAELGFVALSQVSGPEDGVRGSRWQVPAGLYRPIRQDAVLLARGAGNPAAKALMAFLKGPTARETIAAFGYATGGEREERR